MTLALNARPVLYACAGCARDQQLACRVASTLDGRGLAEAACIDPACDNVTLLVSKAKSRYPVFALDGCPLACARHWLVRHGVTPQRYFVLAQSDASAEQVAERIAACW